MAMLLWKKGWFSNINHIMALKGNYQLKFQTLMNYYLTHVKFTDTQIV